jgi:hypothetical protein
MSKLQFLSVFFVKKQNPTLRKLVLTMVLLVCTKYHFHFLLINGLTPWCRRPAFKGGGRKVLCSQEAYGFYQQNIWLVPVPTWQTVVCRKHGRQRCTGQAATCRGECETEDPEEENPAYSKECQDIRLGLQNFEVHCLR